MTTLTCHRVPSFGASTAAPRPEEARTADLGWLGPRARAQLERIMHTSASAVRERLTETVGAFVRGEAVSLAPLPAAVLTVSHLISRDVVTRYRTALLDAHFQEQVERFVVCGPGARTGSSRPRMSDAHDPAEAVHALHAELRAVARCAGAPRAR